MRTVLKWLGIAVAALVGLILLAVVSLYAIGSSRVSKTYSVQPVAIEIPTEAAAIERGEHLVESFVGCGDCHGGNLGGTEFFDDPAIAVAYAPNLTAGKGGAAAGFTDADWVLALRHGVDPHDGRGLLVMPAEAYSNLSAEDFGAVIAYVKSLPPVDNETPAPVYGSMGRILIAAGAFGRPFPAEYIDHASPPPPAPAEGATVEYGRYLASFSGCTTCHGPDLAGGPAPEPGAPPGPNLTPGGHLAEWSQADFITAMRTGQEPDGEQIDDFMPWKSYGKATDDELAALWLYLQSLPAREDAIK